MRRWIMTGAFPLPTDKNRTWRVHRSDLCLEPRTVPALHRAANSADCRFPMKVGFERVRQVIAIFALAVLTTACSRSSLSLPYAEPASVESPSGRIDARLGALHDDLISFRRDLHRHPETSGNEARTAARVADRLESLGFSVRRDVGGHGVVAILHGGRPGRTVAFRADMDAVRSDAQDPVEFDSENPGVRHICGHDIHTTIGVALGEVFAAIRAELPGTAVLIFQPAEENVTGARLMVESGALDNPRPDAIFAYHTAPYEVGKIAFSESTLMSARDRITATVSGPDARGVADALRDRILALRTIESPAAPQPIGADFLWGDSQVDRGEGDAWIVRGNFSLATDAARQHLRDGVEQAIVDLATSAPMAHVEIDFGARFAPGVTNDGEVTRGARMSVRAALGYDAPVQVRGVSPAFSEDFGWMQEMVPGAMFFLGVSNESRGWFGLPHSPDYVADEEAITIGARAMARIMLDSMHAP